MLLHGPMGFIPAGSCSVVIPTGITVTFTGTLLNINISTLTIAGTFTITATGGIGFGFGFAINILIEGGGSFQDQTDVHLIFVRYDSVFTLLSGSSFTGVNTQVSTFTGATPGVGVGTTVTLGSGISGPFTFGVLVDGSIQTFESVMCLVRQSGEFNVGLTWLGGVAPTVRLLRWCRWL